MYFTRDVIKPISSDLKEKMVFIGGPRQVGKTTLARKQIAPHSSYFSWDNLDDRDQIKKHSIPHHAGIVVLDEIHKYIRWRTLLKGMYDKYSPDLKLIVTGSARLDHFRKGGDSLLGRYHYYRLHPISLLELNPHPTQDDLNQLLKFGGFPEPLNKQNDTFLKRWQRSRTELLLKQDITDLARIKEISLLELLADALPEKVGSPLSIKSLQEDLEISPHTVNSWIELLEGLYFCFRISPFGAPRLRAVKKQKKLYLIDWSLIENIGPRFENFVACHLLKYCHYREDVFGDKMEVRYIRDIDLREIDFVVIRDNKPLFAVECKSGDKSLSPSIRYFKERTKIPKFYQVHLKSADFGKPETGRIIPFQKFCELELTN